MKTFSRVPYEGAAEGRFVRYAVEDGADVAEGQALVVLAAAT